MEKVMKRRRRPARAAIPVKTLSRNRLSKGPPPV
jgi:hypothetical protein